jgi:hypothetical protein
VTYDEAMDAIHKRGVTVTRSSRPHAFPVARRFGRAVILIGGGRFIDYTPMYDEYRATDWQVHEPSGGA